MTRWSIRSQDFVGEGSYPQGYGMTYEDIVVECGEDEEVFAIDRTWTHGVGFQSQTPVLRAWIRKRLA